MSEFVARSLALALHAFEPVVIVEFFRNFMRARRLSTQIFAQESQASCRIFVARRDLYASLRKYLSEEVSLRIDGASSIEAFVREDEIVDLLMAAEVGDLARVRDDVAARPDVLTVEVDASSDFCEPDGRRLVFYSPVAGHPAARI